MKYIYIIVISSLNCGISVRILHCKYTNSDQFGCGSARGKILFIITINSLECMNYKIHNMYIYTRREVRKHLHEY